MWRDILIIVGITAMVVLATLLIGPRMAQIQQGSPEPAKSIPIPSSDQGPLADGRHDVQVSRDVAVVGTIVDADWGSRVGGCVTIAYQFGEKTYSQPPKYVGPDGEIDLKFPSPAVPFRVVVFDRDLGMDSGWTSDIIRSNEIDIGEVPIPVRLKPVLLKFSRHYGETMPDGFVTIWSLATDPPTFIANEAEPIAPGRYLVRYTKVLPTWYREVEFGKDGTIVALPTQQDFDSGSVEVVLRPQIEAIPITATVRVTRLEDYGFRRELRSETTRTDGTRLFASLPPGRYEVSVEYDDAQIETESAVIDLGQRDTRTVEFQAYTNGDVSAQLTRLGLPVPNSRLHLYWASGWSREHSRQLVRVTDSEGRAEFGIPPWERAAFRLDGNWRASVPVPPTRESTNHVHIELQPPGTGHLKGNLAAADGVEMRGKLSLTLTHDETGESRLLEADRSHRFEMVGLPFGHYHLRAEWRLSPDWYEGRFRSMDWFFKVDTKTLELDFPIIYGALSGDVGPFLDTRLKPEFETQVWIYSFREPEVGWRKLEHAAGSVAVDELAPGRYAMLVRHDKSVVAYAFADVAGGETATANWTVLDKEDPWPDALPAAP